MAIDIAKEMAERFPFHTLEEYMEYKMDLLERILRRRSLRDFRSFYDRFRDDPYRFDLFEDRYRPLFGAWWMSHLEVPHLRWICHDYLSSVPGLLGPVFPIVADRRFAAEKRALLCHAVFDSGETAAKAPHGGVRLPPLWYYNRDLCGQIMAAGRGAERAAIGRLCISPRDGFRASAGLESAAAADNIAVFELNREIEGRRITGAMLEHLIRNDAARCFTGLLSHHKREVFKLRSPEEWLLTVCRCAKDDFAVAAVGELERQVPGVVARTRDPWGNTALWNTFCNAEPTEKLEAELIRFGCDPDERNELDLSYRLLKDHDPGMLRMRMTGR